MPKRVSKDLTTTASKVVAEAAGQVHTWAVTAKKPSVIALRLLGAVKSGKARALARPKIGTGPAAGPT